MECQSVPENRSNSTQAVLGMDGLWIGRIHIIVTLMNRSALFDNNQVS